MTTTLALDLPASDDTAPLIGRGERLGLAARLTVAIASGCLLAIAVDGVFSCRKTRRSPTSSRARRRCLWRCRS